MPRKSNYKTYYDHDDRSGGSSQNIRKVSFMNGSGRIRKNKRPDQMVKRFVITDDDVDMLGSNVSANDRKGWKRQQKRGNFRGRPGSPGLGGQNHQHLRISDWYQVRIIYGSKFEKNYLLQTILKHISPMVFIPNSYSVRGNDVVFYVDDFDAARIIRNSSGKILLSDGHMINIKVREGLPPPVQIDDKLKEKIKVVMAKRYIPANKALDLTKFSSDPEFLGDIHCPLSRGAIMRVVWQIISENISDLVALNLSNNKISSFEDSLNVEVRKLKNLKILHLEENNIKNINSLNPLKSLELTELVLNKNPIMKFFKDNAHYVRYDSGVTGYLGLEKIVLLVFDNPEMTSQFQRRCRCLSDSNSIGLFHSEVRKKFPKLTKLDDMELPPVISFDVADEAKLPPAQPAYMCNPEGKGIVKAFLTQYFALYDSDNRQDLLQAYHDNSSFSLCAFYPPNQKSNVNRLNAYIQESRNLFRVQDYPRRKSRLYTGKQNIVNFLSGLPKSQHDLSSFVVDLTLFTPALINLSVNGVFREPSNVTVASSWPVRHFTRTFLIVPVGQGFCITNDMLLVTNATEEEIRCSFKEETQNAAILQSPSTSQVPQPSDLLSVANAIDNLQLNDSVRMQMVETLATRTGMNMDWSKKCLDETNWDFDRAIWTFTELQSKGSIPPEAFIK